MTDEEQKKLSRHVLNLEGRVGQLESANADKSKDIAALGFRVHNLSEVLRPTEKDLHRRAVLEAEVMEALSHQRHHLDKVLYRLCALENPPPPPSVWRIALWQAIEGFLTRPGLRAWVARRVLD